MKTKIFTILTLLFFAGSLFSQTVVEPPKNLQVKFQTSQNLLPVVNNKLTWDASGTQGSKYVIYRIESTTTTPNNGFKKIASELRHTEFFDYGIKVNTKYGYYVIAYTSFPNTYAFSKPSDTVFVSTEVAPPTYALVSGKVTDDVTGAGIKNAFVQFIPTSYGVKNCNGFKTDSNGNYSGKLISGEYLIYTGASKYFGEYFDNQKSHQSATKVTLKDKDSVKFNIGLSVFVEPVKFSLSGKVTDSSGKAIRAEIVAYTIFSNTKFYHRGYVAKTDSLGNYSLKVNQGDTVVVFAFSKDKKFVPEFYNDKTTFADAERIAIGGNITGINFALNPPPVFNNSLSGNVKNTTGNGLLSHLNLYEIKNGMYRGKRLSTFSDSTGIYGFKNIVPGTYIMFVHAKERYKPTFYRADGKQTTNWKEADSILVESTSALINFDFTLLLPSDSGLSSINGVVKNSNGTLESGAMVYAYDLNNEFAGFAITDKFGKFTLTELDPGAYNVSVDKVGYEPIASTLTTLSSANSIVSIQTLIIKPSLTLGVGDKQFTPNNFKLEQNYPNPFNPSTKISFAIPSKENVTLKIYNILGKEVATLVNGNLNSGNYSITWDASNVSSGIYFYTLKTNSFKETRKMVLMK